MNWTCNSCGEIHEAQFDSCWKCGIPKIGVIDTEDSTPESDLPQVHVSHDMPCSTTPNIPGRDIIGIKGIVCGEAIMGANILRDFIAGITDIVGGRSGVYESKFREGRAIALQEMKREAESLGADAIIGIDIDYETVGNTMLMICASGTAVILKNNQA